MTNFEWPVDIDHATDEELIFLGRENLQHLAALEQQSTDSISLMFEHMFESGEEFSSNWRDPQLCRLGTQAISELRQHLSILPLGCLDSSQRRRDRLAALAERVESKPLHPSLRTEGYLDRSGMEVMVCGIIFLAQSDDSDDSDDSDNSLFYRTQGWEEVFTLRNRLYPLRIHQGRSLSEVEALFRRKTSSNANVYSLDQRSYTILRKSDYDYLRKHPEFIPVYCSYGLCTPKDSERLGRDTAAINLRQFQQ